MQENKQYDKTQELTAELTLQNDRMHFIGSVEGKPSISIDYIPPLGDNLGYTSLELLLLSLASCFGSSLAVLLRRSGKTITSLNLRALGKRRSTHPTGFERITIYLELVSPDITIADVEKLIPLIEGSLCPVYSMIKGNVELGYETNIRAV